MYVRLVLVSKVMPALMLSFIVGVACASNINWKTILSLGVFAFFFFYPAGLWLKGFAQLHNPSESFSKRGLLLRMFAWCTPFVAVFLYDSWPIEMQASLVAFLVLGYVFNARPFALKTLPVADMATAGVLYVLPGVFAYGLLESVRPDLVVLSAAVAWVAGVYCSYAVYRLGDEAHSGRSVATALGARATVGISLVCILLAGALLFKSLGWFVVVGAALYGGILVSLLVRARPQHARATFAVFGYMHILTVIGLVAWLQTVGAQA